MFAPYFSTKPRGTGLGLAIVQRVAVEHRGSIRAEDNPGGGARFIIEIPAPAGTAQAGADLPLGAGGQS
jgi:signal transduction histidine kinase